MFKKIQKTALKKITDLDAYFSAVAREVFRRFPHQNMNYFVEGLANAMPKLASLYDEYGQAVTPEMFERGVQEMVKWTGTGEPNQYGPEELSAADALITWGRN